MVTRAADIKKIGLTPGMFNRRRCGCIEMKVNILGSILLTFDPDLMCSKHQNEYYNEGRLAKIRERKRNNNTKIVKRSKVSNIKKHRKNNNGIQKSSQ